DDAHGDDAPAFTVADFARFGVTVATARAGTVDLGIELPGEVRANADRTVHLAPRYDGVLREVRARVGDRVRAGAPLAVVESATLAPYTIVAPFDGVVVDRHAVAGEAVGPARPILIVSDLDSVWIDIAVYQRDVAMVRTGQTVTISAGYGLAEARGTVSYVSPVLDQATRTATARVVLANPDGQWRPGLFVTALVEDPAPAAVVIARSALQRVDGATAVYVEHDGHFQVRPVTVGRIGHSTAEVLTGLQAGERYAATSSFLVKAELEKSSGGHDH
ncbi:MAG: efflux RND transporter periplasmic adaptor subunit, partial [Candidatus Binatia bacterium]